VVDDNQALRDVVARIIDMAGYDAMSAASGAEATVVDLSPETHIRIEEFLVEGGQEPSRSGFLDTIRGALNAITKGWANGSIFSVRAGTTVCGIRGSAANVAYDPSDGTSTVTHLDGDLHTFEAADIAEGLRRHRANRQALRRRKRLAHGSVLKRAQRHRARRGARAIRERVDARTHSKARLAVLTNRRGRRLERSAEWLNHFSKVRPTGRRKRARTGKTLRSYVQQRRKLRRELRGGPGPGVGPGGRPRPGSGEVREKLRQGRKTIRKQRRRGSPRRRIRRRRR